MNSISTSLKKLAFATLFLFATGSASAQLVGIKTIPGDYATLSAAVTDLNTVGVGLGGVTFQVATGHIETGNLPAITATGTASSPILFQKSGVGANPILYAGVGTGTLDGIIRLSGTDYITFDGIDVSESVSNTTSTTRAEWGYALLKASATNGCQNVMIINSNITLNRANTSSVGIYAANHTTASSTSVAVTSTAGAHSNNEFNSNTINGGYTGIRVAGYADATPYANYDQNNKIGVNGGNTISNFGGGATAAYGVYGIYQNNLQVANNILNGGSGSHSTTLYGIFLSTGNNSNVDIFNNNITLTSGATTSSTYAINNSMGDSGSNNNVNIHTNTIKSLSWTSATSGAFYAINNSASSFNVSMYNNSVNSNVKGGTGAFYGVYNQGSTVNNALIYGNLVYNNPMTSTGIFYSIYSNPTTTTNTMVYDNRVYSNTNGGTFYGIYTTSGATTTITTNEVYENITSGTSMYGVYISTGTTVNVSRNKIYDQTSNGATGVSHGIYASGGTTRNISNNLIGDLKAPSSSSLNAVTGLYLSGGTTINAYFNTVFLNASSVSSDFGTSGVYTTATPVVDLRNNIIVNLSTASGTGLTVAHRRGSIDLTDLTASTNNNLYYAGTPSATNVIFYDGTNTDITLADYKARVAPREAQSITENVSFLSTTGSSPTFLHINPTVSTGIESGATVIAGYTDDYDALGVRTGYPLAGQVNGGGIAPDMGADEGDFTPISLDMGAELLVRPVSPDCYSNPDTVTVRIKNYSGVMIDFSLNPVTVNAAVTGVNAQTFTPFVISTGTLAGGATLDINVSTTYNMSATGTYGFTASTSLTGDGNSSNDAIQPVTIIVSGGVASASPSTVCGGTQSTLTVTGHSGSVQWQRYDEVVLAWVNESGPGNNTNSYSVVPSDTTIYRALICGAYASTPDTINVVNVTPAVTTNASICGPGQVTLSASGAPVLNWYTDATGGTPVNTGTTYSPTVTATTTYYVESFVPSFSGSPVKITEADLGTPDALEIQNLSTGVVNTSGWVVAVSNSYTNINSVNTIVWNLPATLQPGEILWKNDQSSAGANYWGNNLLWNPGATGSFTGWIMILDNTGNVVDFVAWNWTAADIAGLSTTVNGFPVTINASNWSGDGMLSAPATTGLSFSRQGNGETNTSSDWPVQTSSIGTQNSSLTTPWGCSASSRTAVTATVNPVPDVTISATNIDCNNAANGSAVATTTSGTGMFSYNWNTGNNTANISSLAPGTYTVVVTDTQGCTDTATTIITEPTALVAAMTVNDACGPDDNGSVTATAMGGTGSLTYEWNTTPVQMSPVALGLTAGTYTLTVTDANMCMDTFHVAVNSLTVPTVVASNDTTICAGSSIALTASGASTYAWDNGAGTGSPVTVTPGAATNYVVTGTAANGCSATDTVSVSVIALPSAGFTYTGSPSVSFTNTSVNGTSYSWNFGDGSAVETTVHPTHNYLADGLYTVTLIVTNSCTSDTITQQINVIGTGIKSVGGSSMTVSPNPSEGVFTVTLANATENVLIRVMDVHGKIVYMENVKNGASVMTQNIDLSSSAKGVYFLQVSEGATLYTKQIVIN